MFSDVDHAHQNYLIHLGDSQSLRVIVMTTEIAEHWVRMGWAIHMERSSSLEAIVCVGGSFGEKAVKHFIRETGVPFSVAKLFAFLPEGEDPSM